MLAYSTVGQLAYIVLGLALCSSLGIQGGLFHIAGHAFAKITLFFCAGAIFVATGKKQISQMVGIGKQMGCITCCGDRSQLLQQNVR